jgi:hypothetical protein
MKVIQFGIFDPQFAICEPLQELKVLIRAGLLPRFTTLWAELPGGDCSA